MSEKTVIVGNGLTSPIQEIKNMDCEVIFPYYPVHHEIPKIEKRGKPQNPKQAKKCRLPFCDNMTTHNGGYCKPEHCKEHHEMMKNRA
ncbi:MAG: hypothetical protein WC119_00895 [Synergistaceae bacterium]